MNKLHASAYAALLMGGLFFTAGCEKATVAPEPSAATSAQNVAPEKERGLETRVQGTYQGAAFNATLRINQFVANGGGSFKVFATLQGVGGNISKQAIEILEGAPMAYVSDNLISYYGNVAVNYTTYNVNLLPEAHFILGGYTGVVLGSTPITIVIGSNTPRYERIREDITSIYALYTPGRNTTSEPNGGGLTPIGIVQLVLLLDKIALTVGRY